MIRCVQNSVYVSNNNNWGHTEHMSTFTAHRQSVMQLTFYMLCLKWLWQLSAKCVTLNMLMNTLKRYGKCHSFSLIGVYCQTNEATNAKLHCNINQSDFYCVKESLVVIGKFNIVYIFLRKWLLPAVPCPRWSSCAVLIYLWSLWDITVQQCMLSHQYKQITNQRGHFQESDDQ